MRLLVLIFVHLVKSNCGRVEISETKNISLRGGAKWTSASQNSGAETNISPIYLAPTRGETLNVDSAIEDALYNVKVHNCSAKGTVEHHSPLNSTIPNGNFYDHSFKWASNQNTSTIRSLLRVPSLNTPPGPSKLNLTSKTLKIDLADSANPTDGNYTTHILSSNVTKPQSVTHDAKSKLILLSKHSVLNSTKFISEEKLDSVPHYPTSQNVEKVSKADSSILLGTAKRNSTVAHPDLISNENSGSRGADSFFENVSMASRDNTIEILQNSEPLNKKLIVDTRIDREKAPNLERSTIISEMSSNSPSGNEISELDAGMSWLDVITSPFMKKALKYFVTDFYPKKILDTVAKGWKPSNSTKNGTNGQEMNLSPSVVYPLVMEGVSILANRLTDDGSNSDDQEESESVVKGQIVHGVIGSLNKILKPKGGVNQNNTEISNPSSDITRKFEISRLGKDILNSGILKHLLPLAEKVPGEDLQSAMDIITSNTSTLHHISNASGIDVVGILSQLKILSAILQNGPKFGGLSGFQNSTALAEILKKPGVLSSIVKSRSNLADMGNLTNIMNQFLPKNGASEGISPKNPLLRSDFASKILAKSPIAHLGALDESIKRLITNSLEKAVSRVKINEKGEIQINEGMKKMLGKIMDPDGSPGQNRTSDSLMNVLKSAMASGSVKVEPSGPPEDGKPIVRRNVTHHSPLHRKFQEKYGKYYQKSSVEPLGSPHFVFTVLSIITAMFFT